MVKICVHCGQPLKKGDDQTIRCDPYEADVHDNSDVEVGYWCNECHDLVGDEI